MKLFDGYVAVDWSANGEPKQGKDSIWIAIRGRERGPWTQGRQEVALSKAQVRLAQAAMAYRDRSVSEPCRELGIRPVTLYRYVGPQGQLREQSQKVLAS